MAPRRTLHAAAAAAAAVLLCITIASTSVFAAAVDTNVCTLPASALYVTRIAAPSPAPAVRNATTSPPSSRTACWSQTAGAPIDAACFVACSCRRLESERTTSRMSRFVGVCLNTSTAVFKCSGSGVSNCSTYALNPDGSSTLRSSTSLAANTTARPTTTPVPVARTTPPEPASTDLQPTKPITGADADTNTITAAHSTTTNGPESYVWILIAAGIVIAVVLAVCAVHWVKHHPRRFTAAAAVHKRGASNHRGSIDDSSHHHPHKSGGGVLVSEMSAAAARASTASYVAEQLPRPTDASVSSEAYHTYRLGSASGHVHRVYDLEGDDTRASFTSVSNASDSDATYIVEPSSPQLPPIFSAASSLHDRRSSVAPPLPPTGRSDRNANDSQLSYGSYSSRAMDNSFSSFLTDTELRGSDFIALEDDAFALSGPRKKESEF